MYACLNTCRQHRFQARWEEGLDKWHPKKVEQRLAEVERSIDAPGAARSTSAQDLVGADDGSTATKLVGQLEQAWTCA